MTAADEVRRFGRELVDVHDELRQHLDLLLDAVRTGTTGAPAVPTSLAAHCLTFCRFLRAHHQGEDRGMFPVLLDVDPALQGAITDLVRDHDFLAPMLVRLEVMARAWGDGAVDDLEAFGRELDGLAAVLTNHLGYEERTLVGVLDGLDPTPGGPAERSLAAALDDLPGRDAGPA